MRIECTWGQFSPPVQTEFGPKFGFQDGQHCQTKANPFDVPFDGKYFATEKCLQECLKCLNIKYFSLMQDQKGPW